MNKRKLEAQIKLHGETATDLAGYIGITKNSFSRKVNGKNEFTQSEIFKIKEKYNLNPEMVDDIFFDIEVS